MEFVPHDVHLKIAGAGPDERLLKSLAVKDKRIEFLGFVDKDKIMDVYAGALAIPFVPYDEDYGFITIEGMMSRKPVITASDSGGPLEFVIDGVNGFIVEPDPVKIAERINRELNKLSKREEYSI